MSATVDNTDCSLGKDEFAKIPHPKGRTSRKTRRNKTPEISTSLSSNKYYIVYGLGCRSFPRAYTEMLQIDYRQSLHNTVPKENIKLFCHKTSSTLRTIATLKMGKTPLKGSRFVNNMVKEILKDISDGNTVHVFGISFGGAMCARAAEELNTMDFDKSKLYIHTFGSIYVPPPAKVNTLNISHYLYMGDVSTKCSRIIEPNKDVFTDPVTNTKLIMFQASTVHPEYTFNYFYDNSQNIFWVEPNITSGSSYDLNKRKGLLIGTKQEWSIHNNYEIMIHSILQGNVFTK